MSTVLTYDLEGEASRRFLDLRSLAVDEHLVFKGDHREGEFSKSYPHTRIKLRGLYSLEDGLLSIILTDVPRDVPLDHVDIMFRRLVERPDRGY